MVRPARRADRHLAHALLTGTGDVLGAPAAAWTELAAGPDGAAAACRPLAAHAPRWPGPGGALEAGRPYRGDGGARWWAVALHAGLPPGALASASAGDFADAALANGRCPRRPVRTACRDGNEPTVGRRWPHGPGRTGANPGDGLRQL
ncbi:hypothetical protein ACFYYH_34170 [Streptomyces sp. NPDC002018]|uniref:hypothetical protein n=1 Tax=Streptomyces sp. NPDC002018 TaxID=3364629 RepID=UPI0036CE0DBE